MAEKQKKKLVAEYKPGDIIWYEGDFGNEMFIIKSGEIDLLKVMGDSEMVLKTLQTKEFWGEMALFGDKQRKETAKAKTATQVVFINRRMLDMQFKNVPEWLMHMINTIAQRILTTSKGVKINFEISTEFSVIRTLLIHMPQFSSKEERGRSISLQLVRNSLVQIIGMTADAVDESLKKLNLVNLIKLQGSRGKIYVADPERLWNFSEYLIKKNGKRMSTHEELDPNAVQSFDRIFKLMYR